LAGGEPGVQREAGRIDGVCQSFRRWLAIPLAVFLDGQRQFLRRELEIDVCLSRNGDRRRRLGDILDLKRRAERDGEAVRLAHRQGGADFHELVFELPIDLPGGHQIVGQYNQRLLGDQAGRQKRIGGHGELLRARDRATISVS
jgi:hypothetical protein